MLWRSCCTSVKAIAALFVCLWVCSTQTIPTSKGQQHWENWLLINLALQLCLITQHACLNTHLAKEASSQMNLVVKACLMQPYMNTIMNFLQRWVLWCNACFMHGMLSHQSVLLLRFAILFWCALQNSLSGHSTYINDYCADSISSQCWVSEVNCTLFNFCLAIGWACLQ